MADIVDVDGSEPVRAPRRSLARNNSDEKARHAILYNLPNDIQHAVTGKINPKDGLDFHARVRIDIRNMLAASDKQEVRLTQRYWKPVLAEYGINGSVADLLERPPGATMQEVSSDMVTAIAMCQADNPADKDPETFEGLMQDAAKLSHADFYTAVCASRESLQTSKSMQTAMTIAILELLGRTWCSLGLDTQYILHFGNINSYASSNKVPIRSI